MGKRKAGGRPAAKNDTPARTKFDIEERFDDSEDEFQTGRDQILLDEAPDAKRRRRVAEDEEMFQPSDEEILGYESVDEDEDDEDVEGEDYDDEYDDMGRPKSKNDEASDEEDEGIAAWGSSKKDLYNADQIETEVDALEEEQEAKRLQQKQLQAMEEADFGFDESEWADFKDADEAEDAGAVTEVLPQLEITDDMSTEEKLKILKSRYPEFEPLAKDFTDLQSTHKELQTQASNAQTPVTDDDDDEPQPASVAVIKLRALSAYLGAIGMYFMLLASSSDGTSGSVSMSPAELRQHPVMGSLVKFRKLWEKVKNVEEIVEEDSELEESDEEEEIEPVTKKSDKAEKQATKPKETAKPKKLSKSQRAAQEAQAQAEARRVERIRAAEAGLADLDDLVTESTGKRNTKKTKKASKEDDDSDFGDEGALTAREAEEKAKQKRSLRFYTSQLAQKANKRNIAGRDAGGDADIPYRERLRDRQARLNAEAEKRGRQQADIGEELGGDSDEEDRRVRKELRDGGNQSGTDDDEYYDMVAARSKQRKDDKQARSEAYAAAAREGGHVEIQEEVGPDGKRAITYQIEKNKGLTPKRSKDSRNPRVKKRKKYDEKKKKLGSIRQIYKGGESRGGYGGELTGIKKNLVKSVKL
ncbi:Sas10/Utp3/C1D [Penicillium hetheringtonii]|uniref:Sas10/Utp3/C1D n=1 Tax=Penicillium hetheringtonii TaxID=911720 RepID=A0AAD6DEC9_9EURO|nr:Sas10/Utp3/C1D [Penicillium hetheringtonii]